MIYFIAVNAEHTRSQYERYLHAYALSHNSILYLKAIIIKDNHSHVAKVNIAFKIHNYVCVHLIDKLTLVRSNSREKI